MERAPTPVSKRPRANRAATGLRRRWLYALVGSLLGFGAPLGALVVRILQRRGPAMPVILDELAGDWPLYLYLAVSTILAFGAFGAILGGLLDEIHRASLTDSLTGLPNRRHLMLVMGHELVRAERRPEHLSLLLLDVDGLKQINDRGGHAAGDLALRAVANAMREACRRSDLPARISGDEFAVIATGSETSEAVALAERIRSVLARSPQNPHVSIGVVSLAQVGSSDSAAFLDAADEALYAAKETGRDRVVLAGPNARDR